MSQSLLYHAFGVREGYDYVETLYDDGCVRFVLSVTLVIDLESGRIVWVARGKGSEALRKFCGRCA